MIRSFLLSLHWTYLGFGLAMFTSVVKDWSSSRSWKGSRSSGWRRRRVKGGRGREGGREK